MASVQQIDGDVIIRGALRVTGMATLDDLDAAADDLEHQHRAVYAQESATTAAAESRVVHVVKGVSATIKTFKAGSVVANIGDSTVTVDLKKNGTTCLSAVITLDSTNTARVVEEGTLTVTSCVAGDVLEVVVAVTAGTGTLAKGVFAYMDIFEDAD